MIGRNAAAIVLRTPARLRAIEAEVLPLAELAANHGKDKENGGAASPGGAADGQQAPADLQEQRIRNARDLEKYQGIFADVEFWKKIGEEYQNPLIVTGTVLFTPHQDRGVVIQEREVYDQFGRRRVVPTRMYMERKGFILTPKFIFIDGRTGATLYSETYTESVLYNAQTNTPALSSYFELMDKLIPAFLNTLSMQKIRGTRVLLK
jgi:hypothetical protein